jgi:hypothetical protein
MIPEQTDTQANENERLSGYVDGTDPDTWRTYLRASSDGALDTFEPSESERTARAIQQEVCERLSADPGLDATRVFVSVSDGEVILEGEVADRRAGEQAEELARLVAGVTRVHNQLDVRKDVWSELADRLFGDRDGEGHAGSGTRNTP